MNRVNCILKDNDFKIYQAKNQEREINRVFCHHDMNHLLDVCRVAWILNLEENLGISKEIIYAAGLLHDIGRWQEYDTGKDHAEVSSELATPILQRCGFKDTECEEIIDAIANHRNKEHKNNLNRIIYRSDKISRPCFCCNNRSLCKRFQKYCDNRQGDNELEF